MFTTLALFNGIWIIFASYLIGHGIFIIAFHFVSSQSGGPYNPFVRFMPEFKYELKENL